MLSGIRGVIVHVESVTAKFKYDDNKPVEMQELVAQQLIERNGHRDPGAAEQGLRRRRLR